jgi:hypothetical protein
MRHEVQRTPSWMVSLGITIEDNIRYSAGNLLLQGDVIRTENIRATYQKIMVTLFHDMMHKEIEVYMDIMIAKSKKKENHCQNLRKLFEKLRRY